MAVDPPTTAPIGRQQAPSGIVSDAPAVSPEHRPGPTVPGRGGPQHKYLQEVIRRWADTNDWRATIEEPIPGGVGRVDVALRKGSQAVACEIGVTTNPQHEVDNILKCLVAGFGRVIHVSAEQRTLSRLLAKVAESLTEEQAGRLSACTPEGLLPLLDAVHAETQTGEQTVRGFRVRVRFKPPKPETGSGTVAAVIARAMQRLGKKTK